MEDEMKIREQKEAHSFLIQAKARNRVYMLDNRNLSSLYANIAQLKIPLNESLAVDLNKGTGPGTAGWFIQGYNNLTGACHHIINFDNGLKPWFQFMTSAYNSAHLSRESFAKSARGQILAVLRAAGVRGKDGDPIDNNQKEFSWRNGNLFIGLCPKLRKDDPKTGHEFGKKATDANLQNRFDEASNLFTKMNNVKDDVMSLLETGNIDENPADKISGAIKSPDKLTTDTAPDGVNKHWVPDGGTWGCEAPIYKIK